ncbi:NAD(P)H-binding protein [Actinoplanes sp. NPDC048796]|uniref:NAD(P)H-binding protein n=1 Tax=Actinoplanes sp. NPDC048796 TaxID=3155640 RepID=UPI0033DEF1A4
MIVVTGATGQLGSQIVDRLLERVPADRVAVSVRDPRKISRTDVEVRRGDYTDPAGLAEAFAGATQVLLVSANATGGEALTMHRNAIDAARAAGARRILYTSHQGAAPDSLFAPMPDHAATEQYLRESGVPFTSLRNGFYASTIAFMVGNARETGEIVAPADGPVSWTTHADLAEAAAIILAEDGRFEGPTPPLVAPAAYDLRDIAGMLGVRRVIADDEEWAATLPPHLAALMLGMYRASRRGEFATTGTDLERLLGRPVGAVL